MNSTPLAPKELLKTHIKEWVDLDNTMQQHRQAIRACNERKRSLTHTLMQLMRENNLDRVHLLDEDLVYKKHKVKRPISSKWLVTNLQSFYQDNPAAVDELMKHLLEHREETEHERLQRAKRRAPSAPTSA